MAAKTLEISLLFPSSPKILGMPLISFILSFPLPLSLFRKSCRQSRRKRTLRTNGSCSLRWGTRPLATNSPMGAAILLLHAECSYGNGRGCDNAHKEDSVLTRCHFRGGDGEKIRLFAVLVTCEGHITRFLGILRTE